MQENRVAIVSDVVMEFGGAEKVLEALLEMYPNSTLYSLFVVPRAREKIEKKFPKVVIKTSLFQILIRRNRVSKYIAIIKLFAWIYWETLDLDKFELVISSSHSFGSKAVKTKGLHLSYIHTPPRYLYDEFNEIGLIKWPVFWPLRKLLRIIDKNGSKKPDVIVANSTNVAQRIKKYYDREAIKIYPPVDVKYIKSQTKDYFVWVSRLVKQKGADLAIRACLKKGTPLVVVGEGDERKYLQKKYKKTKFVGSVEDKEKLKIMSGAKALIYTSINEDFGIVPVESLMLGVPVIAYNSGGIMETVIDGKNGVLYDDYSVDGLIKALDRFEKLKISKMVCTGSVVKFGKVKFKKEIGEIIKKYDRKN